MKNSKSKGGTFNIVRTAAENKGLKEMKDALLPKHMWNHLRTLRSTEQQSERARRKNRTFMNMYGGSTGRLSGTTQNKCNTPKSLVESMQGDFAKLEAMSLAHRVHDIPQATKAQEAIAKMIADDRKRKEAVHQMCVDELWNSRLESVDILKARAAADFKHDCTGFRLTDLQDDEL